MKKLIDTVHSIVHYGIHMTPLIEMNMDSSKETITDVKTHNFQQHESQSLRFTPCTPPKTLLRDIDVMLWVETLLIYVLETVKK